MYTIGVFSVVIIFCLYTSIVYIVHDFLCEIADSLCFIHIVHIVCRDPYCFLCINLLLLNTGILQLPLFVYLDGLV